MKDMATTGSAFEDILRPQVIARSSFDEATAVGHAHLRLLESNKKLRRFLDVGYFLLCADPDQPFWSMVEHNAQSRM
jgi:hypothetical protein